MFLPLLVFVVIIASCGLIAIVIATFDRIIVRIIRGAQLPVFPTAVGIAILITERPEQWSFDKYHMRHPDIGSIWIANAAYGLHVETAMGKWTPNLIERRIIREAVDWRIGRFIHDCVMKAVQRNMLAH